MSDYTLMLNTYQCYMMRGAFISEPRSLNDRLEAVLRDLHLVSLKA